MILIENIDAGPCHGIRVEVEAEESDRFTQSIPFRYRTIVDEPEYGLASYPKTHWKRVLTEAV